MQTDNPFIQTFREAAGLEESTMPIPPLEESTEEPLEEAAARWAIVHKSTGKVLSTAESKAAAEDERQGLGAEKDEYVVRQTKAGPKNFSMKEGAQQLQESFANPLEDKSMSLAEISDVHHCAVCNKILAECSCNSGNRSPKAS